MGVSRYAAFISADEYGVVVGGFLVNIAAGNEKARHIFINAAGCCEVVPRYVRLSGLRGGSRKSERGAGLGLSGGGAAPFSPVRSSTASVKLFPKNSMTKSTGAAALALAVPVPFVSPDGQAVVPFPAVFVSGAGKLLAL